MNTGIVYDDIFLKHDLPGHPEYAGRLKAIISYLKDHSLPEKCANVGARVATDEEILIVHQEEHVSFLKDACKADSIYIDADTYMNPFSFEAASMAGGGMIDLVKKIINNELSGGIVLSRPPGHHATSSRSMGFCILNTVAMGVRSCILSGKIKRAAIVDIDVHHGNGTQEIFYSDPDVLYISTHEYPHYPGTGSVHEKGQGEGAGTTINIPFPHLTGDRGYARAFDEIVIPALKRFLPEFLFVSIGFDAHNADPLSSIRLSLAGYDRLCRRLVNAAEELCGSRIIFNLEGGYNLKVLGPGIGNIIRCLIGDTVIDDPFPQIEEKEGHLDRLLDSIRMTHNL